MSQHYKQPMKTTQEEMINLSDILRIFTKNWKWFILSLFLFVGLGVLYILMKNPVYQVDALALLKEDEKKSSSSAMSMMSSLSDLGSMMGSKNIDNEVEIFNTRKVMKKCLIDLDMYVQTQVYKKLRKVNVYPEKPFDITVDLNQIDTIRGPIALTLTKQKDGSFKVRGKYFKRSFKASNITSFPAVIKTPAIDIQINKNPVTALTQDISRFYITVYNPNEQVIYLKKSISAGATSKKTTVIRLQAKTDNIQWGKDLLNELIEEFNLDAITDKNQNARLTLHFVNERIKLIEGEIASVEREVESYKKGNQMVDLSTEVKMYLAQMNDYEARSIQTQTQLRMIQYIADYVQDNKNRDKLIPTIGIEDKGLIAVIAKYNEALAERNTLQYSSTDNNPTLNLLDSQLQNMRQNILANIDNQSKSMQIVLKDLQNQDKLATGKIQKVPQQEREFVEIVRQQGIRNTLYGFLLQKREETSLSLASTTPKARVIDEPMPGIKPIAPQKIIVLAIFFLLGIGVPFLFFYLKKVLKVEVESKEELEALSKAEIIGEICRDSSTDKIVVQPHATSPSVELFRLLRTNISFIQKSTQDKVFLLTSTVSGEGKTFISINLAMSFALIDKKVLVVGLDIRNPRLGDYIDVPTNLGLTNYLIDDNLLVADIIQHSGVHKNLDIVQAGPIPPNPNELLMHSRMDEFFSTIRGQYDYIIVDTAPVGLVSDTFLLNKHSDLTLYVSRIGVAKKDSVSYLNYIKEKGKLKNIYVVANDVDLKEKNGGYGYGYGSTHK